ncbi:MAG: hypothetical protein JSV92_02370 [archaeon]|nr:MAG: hypothetical protein JSV92_02370 [archaeon]
MKIKIKEGKDGKVAVLISFDTHSDKFESNYERNKFFRGLYGWTQIIRKEESEYRYHREGLLNEVPHIKVDSSVFIVALKEMERILKYMREWEDKIDYDFFRVLLAPDEYEKLEKESLKGKEIKIR